MYGRSRAGKTALTAELAEHVKLTLGLKSLVYSIDKGGFGPLMPYVELGLVDLIQQEDTNPFLFMNKVAKGEVRENGKWVKADLSKYGLVACESLTGFSDAFMNTLANDSAEGKNVGGAANVSFNIQSDGESMKVGGNNMAHYGIVQNRILDEVWRSQKLNVPYLLWTAGASREDDQTAGGKVIGPAVAGKALTAELPRHFDLTFRIDCLPAAQGKSERHILYLGNSVDMAAGNAVGLGNTRIPLGAKELPPQIEPASIVKALKLIEGAEAEARELIRKRLEAK